jgi:hypothetical protein
MQEVINCGFVSWVDPEWPLQMLNALRKLWSMYNEGESVKMDEAAGIIQQLKEMTSEKNKDG